MNIEYLLRISEYLLSGTAISLLIWVITLVGSLPTSILLAIIKNRRNRVINAIINTYTLLIRGTPLLFQIFFIYYGLPLLFNIRLQPLAAASLSFILSWTAYLTEIIYAGIKALPYEQYQAGIVLGLSYWQIMFKVTLPQAILNSLPAITNQAIEIIYATPLLGVIGMDDLLKNAKVFLARDLRLDSFVLAAIIYLILNTLIIASFKKIETRLGRYKLNYK